MAYLIFVLFAFLFIGMIYGILWIVLSTFPTTNKFRIKEKQKGLLTFYRAEVFRPIFGWTGFYASTHSGNIYKDSSWCRDKSLCQKNIDVYKMLKPIKPLK